MGSRFALVLLAPLLLAAAGPPPSPAPVASDTPRHSATSYRVVPASRVDETAGGRVADYPFLRRNAAPATRPAPVAPGAATRSAATASVSPSVALYNSLNSPGMDASVNNPFGESPPDSTGAIGPNHYVELVNSAITVYGRNLSPISTRTLQAWVGSAPSTPYCDPQIQWDPTAGRWLYAFLFCNIATTAQDFHFGWSKTADPSNLVSGWCHFSVSTSPLLFDFPKLGHNSKYIIVGANGYDESAPSPNPPFAGARLFWIPKPAKGSTTCRAPSSVGRSAIPLLNGDGTPAFTPVPVNTMTGSANGYVVSAHDPFSAPQHKLAVWHVDSSGVLHTDPDIAVSQFTFPLSARQTDASKPIDTGDGRLTQAVGDPTTGIWTQHTVAIPASPSGHSVVRWYEIKISSGVPVLTQQGDIASATDSVFNGAISPRFDAGGAAIVYNRSSAALDPVIGAQVRVTGTALGTMEPGEIVLAASPAADTDFSCSSSPCRWGDYSGASPDPIVNNAVWGTSEINTSIGLAPAWQDQNFALLVATVPHAPTSVSATAGDAAATVTWVPSPFDPGVPVTSYTVKAYVGVASVLQISVPAPATSAYFPGLTNGVTYTFTVFATDSVGDSPESAHSNAVTPPRQTGQAPAPSPLPRLPVAPAPTPTPAPR